MLGRSGFICMNGCAYDPQLGCFLSPDLLVQAPTAGLILCHQVTITMNPFQNSKTAKQQNSKTKENLLLLYH